ncbi:MAG: 50S ribosomal protein L22 [Deltaproteobacteria bacterium]|jgi:large subunit ribosomal protein L22|nr:50S ribosomal protein L22 [Deltaproteobacteria bacterium]
MEVTAKLRNYRVSTRKARLLADEIRGKGVEEALTILDLSNKRFAKPLAKLVRSALANAEEKNERDKAGIDVDNLVVETIMVDQGASMWRIRARAQGRAAWIQRRTSHVSVVLAEN